MGANNKQVEERQLECLLPHYQVRPLPRYQGLHQLTPLRYFP